MRLTEFFNFAGNPYTFYPGLTAKLGVSTNAAVLLCLIGWRTLPGSGGWVPLSAEEVERDTGLSKKELGTAREQLVTAGVLEERYVRLDHQMFYRIKDIPEVGGQGTSRSAERELRETPKGNQAGAERELRTNVKEGKLGGKKKAPAPAGPTRPESGPAILDAEGDPKQETLSELEAPATPSKFKAFVELWSQSYEAHIGAPYPFNGGRDGKAAKALTSNCRTATELVELAAWCWGNLTGYVQQQCLTIHGFQAQQAVVQGIRAQREGRFKKDVLTDAQREANVKAGDGWKNELADW